MRWILGIDTSSIDMGIGLFSETTPVATYSRFIRNSHAEHIAHITDMLLKTNEVAPEDINHIAISTGPGSFTGLRIGIAFAKGFCIQRSARIHPVSSLHVLAYGARWHQGKVFTAIDARNNEVFWASFSFQDGKAVRLTEDALSSAERFMEMIRPNDIIITDTMGYAKSTVFSPLKERATVFAVEKHPVQRGLFCAHAAAQVLEDQNCWHDPAEILPHYLRLSAAQLRSLQVSQ